MIVQYSARVPFLNGKMEVIFYGTVRWEIDGKPIRTDHHISPNDRQLLIPATHFIFWSDKHFTAEVNLSISEYLSDNIENVKAELCRVFLMKKVRCSPAIS